MKSFLTGFFAATLFFAFGMPAMAQFKVQVDSINVSAFPAVTMQVTTTKNGVVERNSAVSTYKVTEDGFEQSPLTVNCAVGKRRLIISFIVGTGRGHTQADVNYAGARIQEFVDEFDGFSDEASITFYNAPSPACQPRISDTNTLDTKASSMVALDAPNYLYEVLYNCSFQMDSTCTLILFSNGQDNGSPTQQTAVTNAYLAKKIPVYLFHVGSASPPQWLVDLANNTGGAVSTTLGDPVQDIIRRMRGTPDYCLVSYISDNACRDGLDRELTVEVNTGQDNASVDTNFILTADASTNAAATFTVEDATITAGKAGVVPISIPQTLNDQRLYSGDLQLNFDPAKLQLDSVSGFNALAAGSTFSIAGNASGAKITFAGVSKLDGTGALFFAHFKGAAVPQPVVVPVTISDVNISRGCLVVQTAGGDVTVTPKEAEFSITVNTLTFNWDNTGKKYNPEIQGIVATILNTGDLPITGLTGNMTLPLELKFAAVSGPGGEFAETSLGLGQSTTAVWYVKPQPQKQEVSVQANITVNSAEGATASKTAYVNIKTAESGNRLFCSGQQVVVDNGVYTPDPAEVKAILWGVGVQGGPAGQCTIILPAGINLQSGGTTLPYPQLSNGLSSELTWRIKYQSDPVEQTYPIMFVTSGAGVNPDTCVLEFVVPGLSLAVLETPCITAPTNVDYDETLQKYDPDPFTVESYVRNTGTAESDTVWAELVLPAGLAFAAGDMAMKMVSPAIAINDSTSVSWQVAVSLPDCEARTATLTYRVWYHGVMIEECTKAVRIEKRSNEPPAIDGQIPPSVSTLYTNVPYLFQVITSDPNGDTLHYIWRVNGMVASTDSTTTYTHTFTTTGSSYVTCTVIDFCGDSVFAIWTFNVLDSTNAIGDAPEAVMGFAILGNYPNPFNPSTTIEYRVPDGEHRVTMELLDTNGKLVKRLLSGAQTGGVHRYELNAAHLPSGSYIVRLSSGTISTTRTIMLVK